MSIIHTYLVVITSFIGSYIKHQHVLLKLHSIDEHLYNFSSLNLWFIYFWLKYYCRWYYFQYKNNLIIKKDIYTEAALLSNEHTDLVSTKRLEHGCA